MPDYYDTIFGGPPTDPQQQQQMAAQLRGQDRLGLAIGASPEKDLTTLGGNLRKRSMDVGGRLTQSVDKRRAEAVAKEKEDYNRKKRKTSVSGTYKTSGGEVVHLESDNLGRPIRAGTGELYGDMSDLTEIESGGNTYKGGKSWSFKDVTNYGKVANQVRNVGEVVANFNDGYAQPSGLPTGWMNEIAMTASRNDVMKYISENDDKMSKEAARWWADWRMLYTLPERHDKFGATLTPGEASAWAEAENVRPGMAPEEIKLRVERLRGIIDDNFMRMNNLYINQIPEAQRGVIMQATKGLYDYDEKSKGFVPLAGEPVTVLDEATTASLTSMLSETEMADFQALSPKDQGELMVEWGIQ